MIRRTISHYEILDKLGAGGMGVVYRGHDSRLDRDVAIKALPEDFASDRERLARFEREAKVLASLNHPHIASIHGMEKADGQSFLILELVEGETLAERIAKGPVPVQEALELGRQIAEALEAAHEQGIIHRDLKPANVKVKPDGTVKVLDFGLAKAWAPAAGDVDLTQSPTLTAQMTQAGVIMGTAAYMSPEQARSKPLDKRTDIWAFGCVLFEMLTGQAPFAGETASDVLAAVLAKEPDWEALDRIAPPAAARLVRRCLAKDLRQRLRDAGDVQFEIEELIATGAAAMVASSSEQAGPATAARSSRLARAVPWALLAAALALAALVFFGRPGSTADPAHAVRMGLDLDLPMSGRYIGPSVVLSPDGSRLAYVVRADSGARLFVRRLDSLHAVALPGTDGASTPFFSPDSTELAFFAEGKLKKVPVSAEHPPQTLCDAPWVGGGSWDADGTILLAASEEGPLVRVAASGGVPAAATRLDEQQGERLHRWPQVLPGGDKVLFTSAKRGYDFEDATIQVEALNGGKRTLLLEGAYFGRYLPTGHLLFVRRGTAYVVPLDLDRLVVAGTPTPVVEELLAEPRTGWASLSFSQNGHLVYVKSRAASDDVSIEWVDRQGRSEPLIEGRRPWVAPRLSADGRRLALHDGGSIHHSEILESDIWIFDLERRALARVTHDKSPEYTPLWTPEEDRLVFSAEKGGNAPNLYWVPADGSESPEQLTRSDLAQYPNSWTPDGSTLVFVQEGFGRAFDLWTLDFGANGPVGDPRPLLEAPYRTWRSEISPDGRWLLYTSDESGIFQIYVRPFPDLDGKWQVSAETEHYSNLHARWSRSTPELFYWNGKQMMAVPHQVRGGTFVPGKPLALFGGDFATRSWPEWDVAPDGQRFVMFTEVEDVESPAEAGTPQTVLVLNWFSELAPN